MKTGRNDPCPCGSGKKYKKCCMENDEEAARLVSKAHDNAPRPADTPKPVLGTSLSELPKPKDDKPLDPHMEALNARWEAFEGLDYEGQITLFVQTLDEEELMDDEMAFDMLDTIHGHSMKHGDHDRFEALLEALHGRMPEVYAHSATYYLDWRITHALVSGRIEAIPALVDALAETAGRDIDIFNVVTERLAYHGQLSPLADVFRIAWPQVKESSEIVSWGVDEFAERAGFYEIFDALEHGEAGDDAVTVLESRVGAYQEVDPKKLARFIGYLTGHTKQPWTADEFDLSDQNDADATDRHGENLFHLGVEFLGYLRREEGVPYPKGELARQQIQSYLLQRHAGKLEWRESPLEAAMRSGKKSKHPPRKPPYSPPDHPLCPDPDTLDRFLGGLMNFIFPQRYKAAALMELMPAWLRFLESRQLINAQQREKSLHGLRELASQLLKVWEAYRDDPALKEGLQDSVIAIMQKDDGHK